MKRVMHCLSTMLVGGVEIRTTNALLHFAKHGRRYEHVLCAYRGGPLAETRLAELRKAGIECHLLNRQSRYSLRFFRALRKTTKLVRPDVIHAYNPGASLWTRLLVGPSKHRRIVVHCGGVGVFHVPRGRLMERILLRRTSAFVFVSIGAQRIWENFLPIKCHRRVIYNGARIGDQYQETSGTELPDSPFILLTIARLVPVKAITDILKAVKILHDRGMSDLRFIIVGDGTSRSALERESLSLGIDRLVSFEGYQSDPNPYHFRAHVFLNTSYTEMCSNSLIEAMAARMVCIGSSVGGPSEMIEDGKSGFLVPCTEPIPAELDGKFSPIVYDHSTGELREPRGVDPAALADKIDEARRRFSQLGEMRDAARRRMVEDFSIERYCRSLEDVYDAIT